MSVTARSQRDERPAGLLGFANQGWNQMSFPWTFPEMLGAMWIPTVWPLAVLALGALLARRRARI
jgi:uncharacterized protein (TIGR03382 family)